jgi:hypothetical protein
MKVSFLLAPEFIPKVDWREALEKGDALKVASLGLAATAQNMIYQTWFWLREAGVSCDLVKSLPKEGIVIFVSNTFSPHLVLPPHLFYVDVLADARLLPSTHFHLIQNQAKARWTPHSLFVPHWPQPSLIPRDPRRGSRLEKISFFGDPDNLAPELQTPEWINQLRRELGMFLDFKENKDWHDYSDTDVVLAIRDFSRSPHYHKPATKLYNAWLAGVPFIGGRDSAYAIDGRPGIDYLVATSPQQVINYLRRFKEDVTLRQQLVTRGQESGAAFSRETIVLQWKQLVEETLPTLAEKWKKKSALQRRLFWMTQKRTYLLDLYFKKSNRDAALLEKTIPGIKNYLTR